VILPQENGIAVDIGMLQTFVANGRKIFRPYTMCHLVFSVSLFVIFGINAIIIRAQSTL